MNKFEYRLKLSMANSITTLAERAHMLEVLYKKWFYTDRQFSRYDYILFCKLLSDASKMSITISDLCSTYSADAVNLHAPNLRRVTSVLWVNGWSQLQECVTGKDVMDTFEFIPIRSSDERGCDFKASDAVLVSNPNRLYKLKGCAINSVDHTGLGDVFENVITYVLAYRDVK